jgi:hypothetical protein
MARGSICSRPDTEGQELAGECGAAIRGLPDFVDIPADWHRLVEVLGHQIGVADDGGQQVVEIVGDATGEPADRFHLLRMLQLFVPVVQQTRCLPGSQRVTDRPFELCAHHVLFDVVRGSGARCLVVQRQAAMSRHQDERLVGAT